MKRGFTLIELLVVIAIIAILAAILFPVFARAREKARQTSCLSNVKELMLAIHMYAQDYDETLPIASHWPTSAGTMEWEEDGLQPYVQNLQICTCPSKPLRAQDGYGWNYQEFGVYDDWDDMRLEGPWSTLLGDIEYPASTIIIGDNADNNSGARYLYRRSTHDPNRCPARHNGGGNMGLCDGHAKWYSQSDLRKRVSGVREPWRYAP